MAGIKKKIVEWTT